MTTAETGVLVLHPQNLPADVTPTLRVIGPDGSSARTVTGAATIELEEGIYRIEPETVRSGENEYEPVMSPEVTVMADDTVTAEIPYRATIVVVGESFDLRAHPGLAATLGIGLDTDARKDPRTQEAFSTMETVVVPGTTLEASTYWVSSTQGLNDVLEINTELEGDFSFGSIDASFDHTRTVKFDRTTLNWVAVTEGNGPTHIARNIVPTDAANRLAINDPGAFRNVYGTHFVSQIETAFKVAVVFTVTGVRESELSEWKASVGYDGTVGSGFLNASASVERKIEQWAVEGRLSARVLATLDGDVRDYGRTAADVWPIPGGAGSVRVDSPGELEAVAEAVKELIAYLTPVAVKYKLSPWSTIFPQLPVWEWQPYPIEWLQMYDRYTVVAQNFDLLGSYLAEEVDPRWGYIPEHVIDQWRAALAGYQASLDEIRRWAESCRAGGSCAVPTSRLPSFTRREDVPETARAVTFHFDGLGLNTTAHPRDVRLELLNSRNARIAEGELDASIGSVTLDVVAGEDFVINAKAIGGYVLRVTAPFEPSTDTLTWAPLLLSGHAFYTNDQTSTVFGCIALEFGDHLTNEGFIGAAGEDEVIASLARVECDTLSLRRGVAEYLDASGLERYWAGKRIHLQYYTGDMETFYNWTERIDVAPPIFHADGRVQFPYTAVNVERKLGSTLRNARPQPPVSGVVEGRLESAGDGTRFVGLEDYGASQCLRGTRYAPGGPYHCGMLLVEWLGKLKLGN